MKINIGRQNIDNLRGNAVGNTRAIDGCKERAVYHPGFHLNVCFQFDRLLAYLEDAANFFHYQLFTAAREIAQ